MNDMLLLKTSEWKPWFAWYPVYLNNGKRILFKKIYKRSILGIDDQGFVKTIEYCTLLDLLKDHCGIFDNIPVTFL